MLRSIRWVVVWLWVTPLTMLCLSTHATEAQDRIQDPAVSGSSVRLLTIGNSFSRDATRFLQQLASAGGHNLIHQSIVVGGASLELHARKALVHSQSPTHEEGLYNQRESLVQMLRSQPWDVVTIQQASVLSHDRATYQPHANDLASLVREHAVDAALWMHQTWAYRSDDPRFSNSHYSPGEPKTQEEMFRGLENAYRETAAEIGAAVIPVGAAFYEADTDEEWGYVSDMDFDMDRAVPPLLPNQPHSLHVGYRWRGEGPSGSKLGMDGHHASLAGQYLASCVWYEVLFGESVLKNPFVPPGIERTYAEFLRTTAHQVASESVPMTKVRAR